MSNLPLRRAVSVIGDANDIRSWSGIPYHFLQEMRSQGLVDLGLPLSVDAPAWQRRRIIWNLGQLLRGRRSGGFQYSVFFHESLWKAFHHEIAHNLIIHCFQLLPPSIVARGDVRKWFFTDMTLKQLFEDYGEGRNISRTHQREVLAREKEGYHAAEGLIPHSQWAARSLIEDYGVPPEKVHAVVPGANVDTQLYAAWEAAIPATPPPRAEEPLLVCIGKDWQRKGIDRLLGALKLAHAQGSRWRARILGCPIDTVPAEHRYEHRVEWIGFVNKRHEGRRFMELIASADLGLLLSRAEAGGMVYREFHALGLPVLGTSAGGAPEHMIAGASQTVSPDASDAEIAQILLDLEHGDRLTQLRNVAWSRRREALWSATVEKIRDFWPAPSRAAA